MSRLMYIDESGQFFPVSDEPVNFTEPKETQADRIRDMKDTELAEWLVDIQLYIYKCTLQGEEPKNFPYTYSGWMKWLQEEVNE